MTLKRRIKRSRLLRVKALARKFRLLTPEGKEQFARWLRAKEPEAEVSDVV